MMTIFSSRTTQRTVYWVLVQNTVKPRYNNSQGIGLENQYKPESAITKIQLYPRFLPFWGKMAKKL